MSEYDELKLTGKEVAYKLSEDQRIIVDLTLGYRKPQNEYERSLLAEIEAIKNAGYIVDLPFDL